MPKDLRKSAFFDLVDVDVVITNFAIRDIVETVDQVRDRRLAGAGRSNESDLLAWFGVKRDIMKNRLALHVGEIDIVEINLAFEPNIGGRRSVFMRMLPSP
jgi:hypothetical protein